YTLFPSLEQLLPDRRPGNLNDLTQAFTHRTANFTERWVYLPPIAAAILIGLIGWGASQLTVEIRFIDYFRESTESYQCMRQIDVKLGRTTPLDIIIDAPKQAPPSTQARASQETANRPPADSGWGSGQSDPFAHDQGSDPFAA